ncbi:MAG: hypothetical protein EXR51_08230 [Dehalococcoidia bacterium]|nr:hypothetical protein [Dehalococcoidia bacterium]
MGEELYTSIEGPKGTADIYEITPESAMDEWQRAGFGSARPGDVRYEVRFGKTRQAFLVEGEAASVTCELAGVAYP